MYARRKSLRDRSGETGGEQLVDVARVAVRGAGARRNDEEINLYDVWRILSRQRRIVLGTTLIAGLISAAAAVLMTPVYRAEILLAPVTDMDDNQQYSAALSEYGGLAALAGIKFDHKNRKDESLATLRSRKFTEKFIEDRNLRPVLFYKLWDKKLGKWKADVDEEDVPTPWDAYKKFSKTVRQIHEDRTTGLVTLSVEWRDPEAAAEWANELATSLNTTLREQAVEDSRNAIDYLQKQLAQTTVVDLQQVVHRLVESEMKKIILANINKEFAFKVIDPAVVPEEPFRPKVLPMTGLGVSLGLVTGILLALLLNALRTGQERGLVEATVPRAADGGPP